jgi:serine protease inhibitor
MRRLFPGVLVTLAALAAALWVGCARKPDKPPEPDLPPAERPARADEANEADVAAVARGNNAFALDLHRRLAAEDANLFFSPLSVSTALGMAYAGARGETAAEMARALHYPFEGERLHLGYAGLLGRLSGDRKPQGVQLSVANALWGPYDYNKDFLAVNRDCYAAHVRTIDLPGAEPAINKWAEERTAGRVKDLLPPGSLANSVLVLTNAVYFKGEWRARFKASDTAEEPFRLRGGKQVPVKMMHQTTALRLDQMDRDGPAEAQVLQLPYKGGDLSMVIVLPKSADGLAEVERSLTAEKLDRALRIPFDRNVRVSLPRFTIKGGSVRLKDPLSGMGLGRAFGQGADFSGLFGKPGDVFIGDVIHQAFVEVNEEGSEAAAATAVEMAKGSDPGRPAEPVEFKADHPFLFLVRDNRTGAILFLGRLSNPS